MKPSEVLLRAVPLVGTFEHTEAEVAAAIIIRACQELGDAWQPIGLRQFEEVLQDDIDAGREPFTSISKNPYLCPDFNLLVARGFAAWIRPGEPEFRTIQLSALGLARLEHHEGKGNLLGPTALSRPYGGRR